MKVVWNNYYGIVSRSRRETWDETPGHQKAKLGLPSGAFSYLDVRDVSLAISILNCSSALSCLLGLNLSADRMYLSVIPFLL